MPIYLNETDKQFSIKGYQHIRCMSSALLLPNILSNRDQCYVPDTLFGHSYTYFFFPNNTTKYT